MIWLGLAVALLLFCGGLVGVALHYGVGVAQLRPMIAGLAARNDPADRQRRAKARALARERKRALDAARKQERQDRRDLKQLAKAVGASIRDVLTGIGYVHTYTNPGQRKRRFQEIGFSHAVIVGKESLLYRVGTIPHGQTRYSLFEEKRQGEGAWIARELQYALQREVRVFEVEGSGIYIQVGLKGGVAGIPKLFWWRDPEGLMLSAMDGNPLEDGRGAMQDAEKFPNTRLQINLGVAANRRVVRVDLRDLPNLIVAGVPGSGKSVFLNQLICTWLERNRPDQLQLHLIDLKGGIEFDFFSPLHFDDGMVAEFVDMEAKVAPAMDWLVREMERRQALFKGRCKNISGWNQRYWPKLPYRVLVIDELSVIMYDSGMRSAVETLLKKAVALGRATGIHLILCTQVVKVDVLPTLVTGNVPAKMVFNCALARTSMMVLGHGGAAGLEPEGRGFWQNGAQEEIVQAPLITETQIRDAVERAATMGYQPGMVTVEEILRHVRDNFGWQFPPMKTLWKSLQTEHGGRVPPWQRFYKIIKGAGYREREGGPLWELDEDSAYRYRLERHGRKRMVGLVEFGSVHSSAKSPLKTAPEPAQPTENDDDDSLPYLESDPAPEPERESEDLWLAMLEEPEPEVDIE